MNLARIAGTSILAMITLVMLIDLFLPINDWGFKTYLISGGNLGITLLIYDKLQQTK